jgi:hypothetical protein
MRAVLCQEPLKNSAIEHNPTQWIIREQAKIRYHHREYALCPQIAYILLHVTGSYIVPPQIVLSACV